MIQKEKEKTVGIIGGMGPDTTVDIFKRIIRLTPANDDEDHISCLIDNDPIIPSRIKALIEKDGESPGPYLADIARKLESWGAEFIIIASNATLHYNDVAGAVSIPVVHLINLLAEKIKANFPEHDQVGILTSPVVLMTGLYEEALKRMGVQANYPQQSDQEKLLKIIKDVKAGNNELETHEEFKSICQNMHKQGMKVIIVACTELSLIAEKLTTTNIAPVQKLPFHLIDAAELLAAETVAIVKFGKTPHLPENWKA